MNGLILGIDIGNHVSHVCYYDKLNNLAESVPFIGNITQMENPTPFLKMMTDIEGGPDVANIAELIGFLINAARKYKNCNEVDKLVISTKYFDITVLDALKAACIMLGLDMANVRFISHEECLSYYAFNMHRDLWINGVVLLEYEKDSFTAYRMQMANIKGKGIIAETDYSCEENPELKKAMEIVDRYEGLNKVLEILIEKASTVLEGKTASSVYLTGEGFDTNQLPDSFLKYICNKHRVFVGQNLYVKGACFCAWENVSVSESNVIVACRNRIPATIDMDIVERGKKKIFRVASAGTNWYHATRSVDFIVDECNSMTLHIIPAGGKEPYDEIIDFSDFPYRTGKMSRISVEFVFNGDDRCNITVKDKGFGDFIQSSNKVVYKTIEM